MESVIVRCEKHGHHYDTKNGCHLCIRPTPQEWIERLVELGGYQPDMIIDEEWVTISITRLKKLIQEILDSN